jgi:phage terminase large subunit
MPTQIQIAAEAEIEYRKRQADRLKDFESSKIYYRTHLFDYLVERLGFKPETIDWLLLPEYVGHIWDGTTNPLRFLCDCLSEGVRRIGVESATGTGKTKIGAGIVLWFLECFDNSMIVTTAPKEGQLKLHIWREIGKMFNDFGKGELLTSLKLRMIPGQDDWIAIGFVAGVVANEESSTKAQGFHAEHLLIIFEETPGVPKAIIEAFQNTADAPHNIILAFGNPDHQLDNLHRFCGLPNVTSIRISGLDHPNVVLNNPSFIPGAVTREGILDKKMRYGEDSPLYQSRAKGISPGQSIDALIRLEWVNAAIERGKLFQNENGKFDENKIEGSKALGVDVANSEAGDKAAIAKGKGTVLLSVIDFQCPDANQLGKRDVLRVMNDENISPDRVGVDSVGVGAGTVNALKEMGKKIIALGGADKPVKVTLGNGSGEKKEEEFNNLRSQMYWQLSEDLRNGIISLPNDQELVADLTSPKWETKNGEIIVESKEVIKKRLTHSPNKGDAVVYWNWIRSGKSVRKITAGTRI